MGIGQLAPMGPAGFGFPTVNITGNPPKAEFVALGVMGVIAYALPPPWGVRLLLLALLLYVLWNRRQLDEMLSSLTGISQSVLEAGK